MNPGLGDVAAASGVGWRCVLACSAVWVATGCAVGPVNDSASPTSLRAEVPLTGRSCLVNWQPFSLPGKRATLYEPQEIDGLAVVGAQADSSASLLRERLRVEPDALGDISFSWKVPRLMPQADVRVRETEDAVVRVVMGFAGDESRLSARNQSQFDLAAMLLGERPPYATLMYVWDANAPLGSIVTNSRSDRVRKIVVDVGGSALNEWHSHRRNIAADFQAAFGEAPGALVSVALMTDADNTAGQASAWYGPVCLLPAEPLVR